MTFLVKKRIGPLLILGISRPKFEAGGNCY